MKNKFAFTLALIALMTAVLGCGSLNPLSKQTKATPTPASKDKTLTDKGVDVVVGDEKIGVPECDEVMDMLAAEANNPDDNFVTKAVKATFLNKIKESIRKSVEENKGDKTELAKNCKDFKSQLEKFKAEEDKKNK